MSEQLIKKKLDREIKARKEAEELLEKKTGELYTANTALSELNRNLEWLIDARTKELFISREIAVAANQAKSQFLANMSHEIRTPLNGVIGLISILKGTSLNTTQVEYLELIEHSSELLLAIINDILEFSKIEAGAIDIEKREFNLLNSVESLADVMAANAYKKGLELPLIMDSNIPDFIVSDETRIRQVLLNLIGNAIKFTPTGEVALVIKSMPCNEPGQCNVQFAGKDTGIGIPADRVKAIFEPFSQADVSDTRKYGGSGLGLTISKQIIHALGGEITVESVEGKGSTFSFNLKFQIGQTQIQKNSLAAKSFPNNMRIYLTTINETIANNLKELLGAANLKISQCVDLTEAINKSERSPQEESIIISDWLNAVVLDEAAKNIINKEANHKKLFLLVPRAQKSSAEERLKGLKTTLVNKPIRAQEFMATLSKPTVEIGRAQQRNVESAAVAKKAGLKILVAEDNLINRKVLQTMLDTEGYIFEIVANGQEAMEKIKSGNFNLVLMDCQMPVMDGYEATRQIRQLDSQEKNTPIVALTANALRKTKEKCFEVGMNDFLTKPIRANELFKMIESYKLKILSKGA